MKILSLSTLTGYVFKSSHAGHLEDGLVMDDEIECPMHQGIFNIKSGEALSPPACEDLKTYPVKVDNDKIFIKID